MSTVNCCGHVRVAIYPNHNFPIAALTKAFKGDGNPDDNYVLYERS